MRCAPVPASAPTPLTTTPALPAPQVLHGGRLITIFSASRYCGTQTNKGAFITFGADLQPEIQQFYAHSIASSDFGGMAEEPESEEVDSAEERREQKLEDDAVQMIIEHIVNHKADLYWYYTQQDTENSGYVRPRPRPKPAHTHSLTPHPIAPRYRASTGRRASPPCSNVGGTPAYPCSRHCPPSSGSLSQSTSPGSASSPASPTATSRAASTTPASWTATRSACARRTPTGRSRWWTTSASSSSPPARTCAR